MSPRWTPFLALPLILLGCTDSTQPNLAVAEPLSNEAAEEWITWGGDLHNTRYSPLGQIDADNVGELEIAWRWSSELIDGRPDSNWKATPLYVDGLLYLPTGGSKVAALDPATGQPVWMFTPDPYRIPSTRPFTGSSRAVSYWSDGEQARILHNTMDGRLISIDARTGQADPAFGNGGYVDLKQNLLAEDDHREVGDVNSTAPGIVVGDVIVVQVIGNDLPARKADVVPGYVRGFDVRSGELLWTFHTIPRAGEFGAETWENDSWRDAGAASVWTMMSADPELGYVYLPVESPTHNFYGGHRPGDGLFGESIVALDARTGERVWHYQILKHGVWDYDLPAAPILHDVEKDGRVIKALTVLTKQGMSFVFDRATGEPVWPIEDRPVPTAMAAPGEQLSATQPFPSRPPPYSRLGYHEEDVIDFTPELRAEALAMLEDYVKGPMYTPPTLVSDEITTKGTLVYPNFGGGSNWNGGAVDPQTNIMYVPTRNTFMSVGLRASNADLTDWDMVTTGGGAAWMRLPNGLPINRPPWALVTATDMNKGEHLWQRAIGGAPDWVREHPDLQGLDLDFDNMGQISVRPSPLLTSTLMFLAESSNIAGDPGGRMFRSYDKTSGEVVSEFELPAKTSGAPMTYQHEGRQYIAIALSERTHAAELVTLALPDNSQPAALTAERREPVAVPELTRNVTASAAQLQEGQSVYAAQCSVCHGADGGGLEGGSAPALINLASLEDIRNMITVGAAEMPGFASRLTAGQIDSVSRYLALGFTTEATDSN